MRLTRKSSNGAYWIPLQVLGGVERIMEIDGGPSPCVIGELVNQLGRYEELGDYDQLKKLVREHAR